MSKIVIAILIIFNFCFTYFANYKYYTETASVPVEVYSKHVTNSGSDIKYYLDLVYKETNISFSSVVSENEYNKTSNGDIINTTVKKHDIKINQMHPAIEILGWISACISIFVIFVICGAAIIISF